MDSPSDNGLSATVAVWLRDAMPTARERKDDPVGAERRRVEAVRNMLLLYRDPKARDLGVREFFHGAWDDIICTSDSPTDAAKAMARFLEGEKRPRSGPWGERRDVDLAMAVREALLEGLPYEGAVQKIAEARHLSWQKVANIHAKFKLAAEAEAAFRAGMHELQEQRPERA